MKFILIALALMTSTLSWGQNVVADCSAQDSIYLTITQTETGFSALLNGPRYENYTTDGVFYGRFTGESLKANWNTIYLFEAIRAGVVQIVDGKPTAVNFKTLVAKSYSHLEVYSGLILFNLVVFETLEGEVLGQSLHFRDWALACN